jgi:hypothetical protein
MSSIREHDLRDLGFETVHIHDFDLGEEPYYYYSWKCEKDSYSYLISCVDDEDDLRNYMEIIKRNIIL